MGKIMPKKNVTRVAEKKTSAAFPRVETSDTAASLSVKTSSALSMGGIVVLFAAN